MGESLVEFSTHTLPIRNTRDTSTLNTFNILFYTLYTRVRTNRMCRVRRVNCGFNET